MMGSAKGPQVGVLLLGMGGGICVDTPSIESYHLVGYWKCQMGQYPSHLICGSMVCTTKIIGYIIEGRCWRPG